MLLKVAVAAEVGDALASGSDPMPAASVIRRLRELVLLVSESPEDAASLLRSLRRVQSPELISVMMRLVQNRLVIASHPKPVPADSVWTSSDLATWRNVADTIVMAQYRTELFEDHVAQPEVTSLAGLVTTDALERTERLRGALVRQGTPREDVWRERFAPLAQNSSRVYMIDPYASIALARDLQGKVGRHQTGASWLLRKIASSPVKRIHLASSASPLVTQRLDPENVAAAVTKWFQALAPNTELELVFSRGRFVHGRRLAFDAWAGFDLHKGLASFDAQKVDETMTLTALPSLASDTRDLYRRLLADAAAAR